MHLYLVRHGIAIDREDPDCPPEEERHLTKEGLVRTRQAMEGLRALGVRPEAIWTSPYERAVQTAQIAAEELGFDPKNIRSTEALLPGAEPPALFRELARLKADEVVGCGHAPNLDDVLAHAVGARSSFTALKKAGVACLEIDATEPGRGLLLWLVTAKQLRELRK